MQRQRFLNTNKFSEEAMHWELVHRIPAYTFRKASEACVRRSTRHDGTCQTVFYAADAEVKKAQVQQDQDLPNSKIVA